MGNIPSFSFLSTFLFTNLYRKSSRRSRDLENNVKFRPSKILSRYSDIIKSVTFSLTTVISNSKLL